MLMLHIAASEAKIFRSTISRQDMQALFVSLLLRMGRVEGSVLVTLGALVLACWFVSHCMTWLLCSLCCHWTRKMELQCSEIALGVTKPAKVAWTS